MNLAKVLVLNAGSSSIKYKLVDLREGVAVAAGSVERIGERSGGGEHRWRGSDGEWRSEPVTKRIRDHRSGMEAILGRLETAALLEGLAAIGHRVVHGGERFRAPTRIDDEVLRAIEATSPLAPLHNPHNLAGIEAARAAAPDLPHVAVFDTAFHQTLPAAVSHYPLPHDFRSRYGVRRYGFHGISHRFVSREAARLMGRPVEALDLVTLHLGNGASAAAIRGGASVETSMGMTPLGGLMMGSRPGDLDPGILFHLGRTARLDPDELERLLNEESGLRGVAGVNDMREVHRRAEAGDETARLAVEMYAHRVRACIGAYLAVLGGADAIVFTAGIGEHDAEIRHRACAGLERLGIGIDDGRNRAGHAAPFSFHRPESRVALWVVPTDEEFEIARQTAERLGF